MKGWTRLQRDTATMIRKWCHKNGKKDIRSIRHVHPRAYVTGYAAPQCLVVAVPHMDSEPHMRQMDQDYPLRTVRVFDATLKPGDWCMTAYVSTPTSGEPVAVRWPVERK